MYLKYGGYPHTSGEAAFSISRDGQFSPEGVYQGYVERWDISGRLHAADVASLSAAITALQAAYALQGQDIGLYNDDHSPTAHRMLNSQTVGGIRVVRQPSFPESQGAEYTTFRSYSIGVEGEFLDLESGIVNWTEVVNFEGGGPVYVHLKPINGVAQKQVSIQNDTFRATQAGSAVGYLGYPNPPAPLWPSDLVRAPAISRKTPRRKGPRGSQLFVEYEVSWNYAFESVAPLTGGPTPPPSS